MLLDPNQMHLLSEADQQTFQRMIRHVKMRRKDDIPYSKLNPKAQIEWLSYFEKWYEGNQVRGEILQNRALDIAKWMNRNATGAWSLRMEAIHLLDPNSDVTPGSYRQYKAWFRIALRYETPSDLLLAKLSIR